jgi:hypothetical protein
LDQRGFATAGAQPTTRRQWPLENSTAVVNHGQRFETHHSPQPARDTGKDKNKKPFGFYLYIHEDDD